jgi:hypothetical protein
MKDKLAIMMGILLVAVVLVSVALYSAAAGAIGYVELGVPAIAIILVAFAAYILWDKARNASKGLPSADERLKIASYKAGYYAFIVAIWSAVGAPVVYDILFEHELEGSEVTAIVVIASGFVFAVSYLFLARKGN